MTKCSKDLSAFGELGFFVITLVMIQLLLLSLALLSLRESALAGWEFAVRSVDTTPIAIEAEESAATFE